jgi:hypothetical protein
MCLSLWRSPPLIRMCIYVALRLIASHTRIPLSMSMALRLNLLQLQFLESVDRGFVRFPCEYVSYVVGRGLANFSPDTLYTCIQIVGRGLANFTI